MDAFGITYTIEPISYYIQTGRPTCCVLIHVKRGEQTEYRQYHCYSLKRDGNLKYEEGNVTQHIHQGVLAYLGMDREIDNYFDSKAREVAKDYLTKNS